MADQKLSEMTLKMSLAANSRIYVVTFSGSIPEHGATRLIDLFGSIAANAVFNGTCRMNANTTINGTKLTVNANTYIAGANTKINTLTANTFKLQDKQTPANSTISIKEGRVFFDDDYLYIATANNNLGRVAIASF